LIEQSNRQQGVATFLLSAAADFARESKAIRITLATQISNISAQSLYESLGYSSSQMNEVHHRLQNKGLKPLACTAPK